MKTYRKYLTRSATQQVISETDDTGVITIGNFSATLSGTNQAIFPTPISVPAGGLLLVSEIDVFSSASATFIASYSYSVGGQTVAGNKYYYLAAAGFLPDVQSVDKPIIAMLNLSTVAQTFNIAVVSATSGTLYGANIRYAIV